MGSDIRNVSSFWYVNFDLRAQLYKDDLMFNISHEAARWVDPALGFAVGWVRYRISLYYSSAL